MTDNIVDRVRGILSNTFVRKLGHFLKCLTYVPCFVQCVQFITFGFACTPLYFVWEKVIGMHDTRSICLRALARLPVVIPIWFLAIIFPFFGPINSAVGALLVSFTVYIIPSLAHMLTYRKASARQVKKKTENLFLHPHLPVLP